MKRSVYVTIASFRMEYCAWCALVSCLSIFGTQQAVSAAPDQLSLDQRNMNYHSGPEPLNDFAAISGSDGQTLGTISMIDGNQVAYFDESGQIISGKGRFQYKSKTPEGLYMDSVFKIDKDVRAHGGIRVADMTIEYRFDGTGPDAKQFVYVHTLKTAGNAFEYSTKDEKTGKITPHTTTFSNLALSNGSVSLTIAELPGWGTNVRCAFLLRQPLSGELKRAK